MGSLSFAEIVTIVVIILIIFGPNRLPEFAKKLGELMAKARKMTSQFTSEISGEFSDAADPLKGAKDDYDGIKDDLKKAGSAFTGYTAMPDVDEMPSVDKKLPPVPENPEIDDELETGEIEIASDDEDSK